MECVGKCSPTGMLWCRNTCVRLWLREALLLLLLLCLLLLLLLLLLLSLLLLLLLLLLLPVQLRKSAADAQGRAGKHRAGRG